VILITVQYLTSVGRYQINLYTLKSMYWLNPEDLLGFAA